MTSSARIGFMQGRLSTTVGGMIELSKDDWQAEFPQANEIGLGIMEWTLDQQGLYDNPLMTEDGRAEIKALCDIYQVGVPSVTCDCLMQFPFWKAGANERDSLEVPGNCLFFQ